MTFAQEVILSILVVSALLTYVNCHEEGCGGLVVTNSKIKITGADIMGYPEDIKFELEDCILTLTEDLDFKEINNMSVSYKVKKGSMINQEGGPVDLCDGLKEHSDSKDFACLVETLGTKECPILEGKRRGACDFSSKKETIHRNSRIAKGKTEFKLEFFTDKGETLMEGFIEIQKLKHH